MSDAGSGKHVVIVGHGRSGTNMTLDLLDCHRDTFCRNEPSNLVGSSFTGLGDEMFIAPEPQDFATRWRRAVAEAATSNGDRDRFTTEKDYFRSPARARLGQYLMSRRKFRACILPRSQGRVLEQWPCPRFHYDRDALKRALPVLKILMSPAWVIKGHDTVPELHTVHMIRRPEGFIQSWWNRYVLEIDARPERIFENNRPSVNRILKHFGKDGSLPEAYSLDALVVSELWRWRYMNEVLLAQLSQSPRYLVLSYEEVMRDKLCWAREIYGFAGLEMTPDCQQSIEAMENTLFRPKKTRGLDAALVAEALSQVMDGSPWRAQLLETPQKTPA